jgi:hypothetical protein
MAKKTQGVLDDTLTQIKLTDFTGGLNTMDGPLSLASNQTFSCQNVISYPGRLFYIGGFNNFCSLPSGAYADASWEFYDINNNHHLCVWASGNLYDCVSGAYTLIASNVYTAGQQVGRQDLGGVLYYCTATVPLRQWNGTVEKAVPNSGGTGVVPPPSGTVLAAFAGSLICGNPTVSSTYYPGGFIYSDVNDPTTWYGNVLNQLGSNEFIQWIVTLGVSSAGVPPTGSFMIGCTNQIFIYKGPLNSLTQNIVNCPVGAADPNSAFFVPSPDLFPGIIFLGSDGQFWISNGITTGCISLKIMNLVYSLVQGAKLNFPNPRYFATYNAEYFYYMCDFGSNQQLVYMVNTKSWFFVNGWPSGPYISGHDNAGFPANFVATNNTSFGPALYETGLANTTFDGRSPSIYYSTAYLHGGDFELWKEWQWIAIATLNYMNTYQVSATSLPRADNTVLTSQSLTFSNANVVSGSAAEWDVSQWDVAMWAGLSSSQVTPCINHGMLSVAVPASTWVRTNTTQPLRSSAVYFTISWLSGESDSGTPALDLIGIIARYVPRGRKPVGGQLFTAQSGITFPGNNPWLE